MKRNTNPAGIMLTRPVNAWAMESTPAKLKVLALAITQTFVLQIVQQQRLNSPLTWMMESIVHCAKRLHNSQIMEVRNRWYSDE